MATGKMSMESQYGAMALLRGTYSQKMRNSNVPEEE